MANPVEQRPQDSKTSSPRGLREDLRNVRPGAGHLQAGGGVSSTGVMVYRGGPGILEGFSTIVTAVQRLANQLAGRRARVDVVAPGPL
jgi:hypothetical protein